MDKFSLAFIRTYS